MAPAKCLILCEEKGRLLDAYVTATDRQFEAVKAISAVAAKDNRAAFKKALAHSEQARQDAEEARLALHRCTCIQKLMAAELRNPHQSTTIRARISFKGLARV
jgi:hypothetical protein